MPRLSIEVQAWQRVAAAAVIVDTYHRQTASATAARTPRNGRRAGTNKEGSLTAPLYLSGQRQSPPTRSVEMQLYQETRVQNMLLIGHDVIVSEFRR